MIKQQLKLTIDLVPKTCWYSSLYRRMPQTKWGKIRQQAYSDAEHACQICGAEKVRLECHEIWEYDDEKLIQKLRGFIALCVMCHHVKHFGRSEMLAKEGKLNLDALIAHFCKVNKVLRNEFSAHKSDAFNIWRIRSQKNWTPDLGRWSEYIETQ